MTLTNHLHLTPELHMLRALTPLLLCLRGKVLRHKEKLLLALLTWLGCCKARHFSLCHRLKTDNGSHPVSYRMRNGSCNTGGVKFDHYSYTVLDYVKVLLVSLYTAMGTGGNFRSIRSCNWLDKRVRFSFPKQARRF